MRQGLLKSASGSAALGKEKETADDADERGFTSSSRPYLSAHIRVIRGGVSVFNSVLCALMEASFRLILDIARARFQHHDDPCGLAVRCPDRAVAVILDGAGHWGSGIVRTESILI